MPELPPHLLLQRHVQEDVDVHKLLGVGEVQLLEPLEHAHGLLQLIGGSPVEPRQVHIVHGLAHQRPPPREGLLLGRLLRLLLPAPLGIFFGSSKTKKPPGTL